MSVTITTRERLLVGLSADDTSQDDLLAIFLDMAQKKVIKARYPFGSNDIQKAKALSDYSDNVDAIYIYLFNKQGAEGEVTHNENGINRTYESAGIPNSYVSDIAPMCKV